MPWTDELIDLVAAKLPTNLKRSWAIEILDAIQGAGYQIHIPTETQDCTDWFHHTRSFSMGHCKRCGGTWKIRRT